MMRRGSRNCSRPQPQVISPRHQSATGAEGSTARWTSAALNGGNSNQEQLWSFEGDDGEFKSGDASQHASDQRITQSSDQVLRPV